MQQEEHAFSSNDWPGMRHASTDVAHAHAANAHAANINDNHT